MTNKKGNSNGNGKSKVNRKSNGNGKAAAAAAARATTTARVGEGEIYIPTLGAMKPRRRWGTRSFVAGWEEQATATAKTEADPCGMTNKQEGQNNGNGNCKDRSRSLWDDKQEGQNNGNGNCSG